MLPFQDRVNSIEGFRRELSRDGEGAVPCGCGKVALKGKVQPQANPPVSQLQRLLNLPPPWRAIGVCVRHHHR